MSKLLQQAYAQLEANRKKQLEEEEEKKLNLSSMYQEMFQPKEAPIGYSQLTDLDNVIKSETKPTSIYNTKKKKSLTELYEDEEFSTRSERFLEGVGSNDNIFEYLRDSEYSLSSAMVRSFQTGKWTDEQKEDYVYLKNEFNNTELKGFKEHFGLVKDIVGDVVLDPLNILAAMFAIPSGGVTAGGRAAIGKALQQSTKAFTEANLKKDIIKKTGKEYALYGSAEGFGWGGLHNYFMQDMNVDLGLVDKIDLSQTAASGLIGGVAGGLLGAGIGGAMGKRHSKFAAKEFMYANEDAVSFIGPKQRKIELENWEIDQATRDVEDLDLVGQDEDIFFNMDNDLDFTLSMKQRIKETVRNNIPKLKKKTDKTVLPEIKLPKLKKI